MMYRTQIFMIIMMYKVLLFKITLNHNHHKNLRSNYFAAGKIKY